MRNNSFFNINMSQRGQQADIDNCYDAECQSQIWFAYSNDGDRWWSVQIVQQLTFKRQRRSARTSSTTSFVHIRGHMLVFVFVYVRVSVFVWVFACSCVSQHLYVWVWLCVCVSVRVSKSNGIVCTYPVPTPLSIMSHDSWLYVCVYNTHCVCVCAHIALLVQTPLPSYKPSE